MNIMLARERCLWHCNAQAGVWTRRKDPRVCMKGAKRMFW
jgi:hypothetical protein